MPGGFCPSDARDTPYCIQSNFKSLERLYIHRFSWELIKEFRRTATREACLQSVLSYCFWTFSDHPSSLHFWCLGTYQCCKQIFTASMLSSQRNTTRSSPSAYHHRTQPHNLSRPSFFYSWGWASQTHGLSSSHHLDAGMVCCSCALHPHAPPCCSCLNSRIPGMDLRFCP